MTIKTQTLIFEKSKNLTRNYKRFHEYYFKSDHNKIYDWEITKIDQAETKILFKAKGIIMVPEIKNILFLVLMSVMFTQYIRRCSLFMLLNLGFN